PHDEPRLHEAGSQWAAAAAPGNVPRRRESRESGRRLHALRHDHAPERGGVVMQRRRLPIRPLADERGQSLVIAMLVLFVLAVSLASVILFTSGNQRNSNYQKSAQVATSLAEAGVNNAVSILSNPANANTLELST